MALPTTKLCKYGASYYEIVHMALLTTKYACGASYYEMWIGASYYENCAYGASYYELVQIWRFLLRNCANMALLTTKLCI